MPDPEHVKHFKKTPEGKQFEGKEMNGICADATFKQIVMRDMITVADKKQLRDFERVHTVHLEPDMWKPGELLTPSFKLKRNKAQERYRVKIDALYDGLLNM